MAYFDQAVQSITGVRDDARMRRQESRQGRQDKAAATRQQQQDEWATERHGMETKLFDAKMKKIAQETAADERKQKMLGDHDDLNNMIGKVEKFMEGMQDTSLTKEKMRKRFVEATGDYDDSMKQVFSEAVQGDYGKLYEMQAAGEERLVREGYLKEAKPRQLAVSKPEYGGKLATMSDSSRMFGRELTSDEKDAIAVLGRDAFGTPAFKDFLNPKGGAKPSALIEDLPPVLQKKAVEAFQLAGGGDKGVKALQDVVATGKETLQREEIGQMLDDSFPNATPAERLQLEATAKAGKTVESGLKSAEKLRTEQRRLKKAQGFQQRAVSLLDGILASDQVGDVTGSIEGTYDFRATDVEAELIADIDEAQNILTAENMDLMTGVLSESDILLLKNLSSGALNRKRGEKRFRKDAEKLRDKLKSELVQTVDDAEKGATRFVYNPESGQLEPK